VNWVAMVAWLLGIVVGLAFTVSPWFKGPLAQGIFATSSLGYLIGFVVSALAYWLLVSVGGRWAGMTLAVRGGEALPEASERLVP
jgi:NCS1 family nucleobase:cation symporter-1